jgi:hypothetical protein
MTAGGGRPWPLLAILQRESRAPDELARREQNPTEPSGIDALIDVGS